MPSTIERKLAAIMFTDIVGYTAQMSKDEDKAFALIKKKRDLLLPLLEKHEGKLIKEIGDGTMTRYFKADHAIDCATSFQAQTDKDLNIRAGIHMGEVIIDKEDVFGDVVNIAARLESFAVPGSVFVSKETIDKLEISDKVELVSLGLQSLKGVGRLIEVFAIKAKGLVVPDPNDYLENKIKVHSDDEVPSIAIIPFENKGKEDDAFYAYSISVDLISDVSSAGLIRVASKKQIDDAGKLPQDELAKKLDVRYITHGELWKMVDMFQLSIELYDTKDKKVIWSDRWQEKWDNLPMIKDSLSDGLLKALDASSKVEMTVDSINPEAYEFYLKAKHTYEKRKTTDDVEIVRGLLKKAIELDDNLIEAKIMFGVTYADMGNYDKAMNIYNQTFSQAENMGNHFGKGSSLTAIGNIYNNKGNYDKALNYHKKALIIKEKLNDKFGIGGNLGSIGIGYGMKGDYDKALKCFYRAFTIQEELGDKGGMGKSLNNIGNVYTKKKQYDNALKYFKKAFKISETCSNKSGMSYNLYNIGILYKYKGNYNKALEHFNNSFSIRKSLGDKRGMGGCLICIGMVFYKQGRYEDALKYYKKSLTIQEDLDDKRTMGYCFNSIGEVYGMQCDYEKALNFFNKALKIREMVHPHGIGTILNNIGVIHQIKGEYNRALDFYNRSIKIDKSHDFVADYNIGVIYYDKFNYIKAQKHLEKSLKNAKKEEELSICTYLYLTYKYFGKKYNIKKITKFIKEKEHIEFEFNLRLYELLEDKSYLEKAYNQVQEKASAMGEGLKAKFLSYLIPKAIVEKYNKVFK